MKKEKWKFVSRILIFSATSVFLLISVNLMADNDISKMITELATKYNIDPKLALDIAMAESSLNPDARGKGGESGLYQLHPKYVNWISTQVTGKKVRKEELFNPQINANIGIGYLAYLKNQLGNKYTPALLIQSYNQGLGYTQKNNFQITDEMKKHPNKIYRSYFSGQ